MDVLTISSKVNSITSQLCLMQSLIQQVYISTHKRKEATKYVPGEWILFLSWSPVFSINGLDVESCSTPLQLLRLGSARFPCSWNLPGKNTGVDAVSSTRGLSLSSWPMSLAPRPLTGRFFTTVPPVWIQFTLSVLPNNLQSHRLQPARIPWPSPTPGACWNLCPSSWWWHPTNWSSAVPFSSFPQSFPASGTFLTTSPSHQVARVLEFQLQHQSFQWNSGLISFRMVWFYPVAVQGSLKSLFQNHTSKESIIQCSSLYIDQISQTWLLEKPALTRQTIIDKVMSLLFNMLSRLVIAFLPRSKCLLISGLQSPSAVILEPKKMKSVTVSIVSPSIFQEMMGPDAMIFFFECWVLSHFHSSLSAYQAL